MGPQAVQVGFERPEVGKFLTSPRGEVHTH